MGSNGISAILISIYYSIYFLGFILSIKISYMGFNSIAIIFIKHYYKSSNLLVKLKLKKNKYYYKL